MYQAPGVHRSAGVIRRGKLYRDRALRERPAAPDRTVPTAAGDR